MFKVARDALNGALANAQLNPHHHRCGPLYFNYMQVDTATAAAFDGDSYSFIGMSVPMAKDIIRMTDRLRDSVDIWNALGLTADRSDSNSLQFLLAFFAILFVASHEYSHHVLGHIATDLPADDPRAASLRGHLQSQTRELAADGYAAMHLLQHVISGDFRAQTIALLGLETCAELDCDRILFLLILVAVAATWYRNAPELLDAEDVYLLTHPPRAMRLSAYMEHAGVWSRAFRPSLNGTIDGQTFANLMYVTGLAVSSRPEHADSRLQNAFMRSTEGQEYSRQLLDNLKLHKSMMGR